MQGEDDMRSMGDLLTALRRAGGEERVLVRDTLRELGERSFTALMLVVALLLVSPISGIPTVPSFGAALILLIAGQAMVNRGHLWLPDILLDRGIATEKWCHALDWLKRPAAFVDRHTRQRLCFLTRGVAKRLVLLTIMLIALTWPLLEILPMFTSVGATVVAFLTFGLFARDGLFIVLGFAALSVLAGTAVWAL